MESFAVVDLGDFDLGTFLDVKDGGVASILVARNTVINHHIGEAFFHIVSFDALGRLIDLILVERLADLQLGLAGQALVGIGIVTIVDQRTDGKLRDYTNLLTSIWPSPASSTPTSTNSK